MQAIGMLFMALSFLAVPLGAAVWLYARRTGRPALARNLLLMGGGWAVLYLGLLLTTSLTSQEIVLDQGERKTFCGFYLDCHIGATVEEVTTSKRVESDGEEIVANGLFHLVTVSFSSDARQATLSLPSPDAVLMDALGHRYIRNRAAEQALSENADPLPASIQTGQNVPQTFVFDVPPSAEGLMLHVTMGDAIGRFVEAFLIGDDDSLLHRRTLLKV